MLSTEQEPINEFSFKVWNFAKTKVFNFSELHFSKVTSYKVHNLVYQPGTCFQQKMNNYENSAELAQVFFLWFPIL